MLLWCLSTIKECENLDISKDLIISLSISQNLLKNDKFSTFFKTLAKV